MKKMLMIVGLISGVTSFGQVISDQVSVQPGYTNQVYYSLENGEVSNISNQDWDLAFDVSSFGSAIRINGQLGHSVYVAETDTSNWMTVDTNGMASSWTPLYNSDINWATGALNADHDPSNSSDLGWGLYNSITHHINGTKIFAVLLPDGSVKKLMIRSLVSGTYTFRIANLDNSDDHTQTVVKNDYSGKNFAYYSFSNNTVSDREPGSGDWDIVFTKYIGELSPNVHYGVTGALTNNYIEVYEATGDDAEDLVFDPTYQFETDINVIGYDWKTFSFGIGSFVITDSLAYFIKTPHGDYWKLVMTGFGGSANGDIMFTKEKIGIANITKTDVTAMTVYPNPTTGSLRIDSPETLETVSVYNYDGQLVFTTNEVINTIEINLANLPNGMYLLKTMTENGQIATQKIVKI